MDLAAGQNFGYALTAADFDGDGSAISPIGAPFVDGTTSPGFPAANAGAVYVLYGALSRTASRPGPGRLVGDAALIRGLDGEPRERGA